MDEDIAGSNNDTESIPYKERFGKWNVENEKIFKEGRKEPVADNSLNNNGEKVDTQTPESQATSATRGNLLKQPGQSNGENNLKNQDFYTPQEKVRSPVQQASFSGCWDSAETASVPRKQNTPEQIKEEADLRPENLENGNIEVHCHGRVL